MKRLAIAGGAAIAAFILYRFPPGSHSFYPRCWFFAATGLQCPGCGATRAAHELLHGHVAEAFALNPLLFALIALMLAMLPSIVRGEQPRFTTTQWFRWTSVVVVVVFWVGRNG